MDVFADWPPRCIFFEQELRIGALCLRHVHPTLMAAAEGGNKSLRTMQQQYTGVINDPVAADRENSDLAIKNIAIATDFSPWSDRALQYAAVTARFYGAALHIVHTVRPSEFSFVPELMIRLDDLAERDFDSLVGRLRADHSLDQMEHRFWSLSGEVSDVFSEFAREQKIDLLVLGTRGRSILSKLILGSIAEQISHCVSCPVLTVGPWSHSVPNQRFPKKVLFATDLSKASIAAVPYVVSVARMWRTGIDVLHVCSSELSNCDYRMLEYSLRLDALTRDEPQVSVCYHILSGHPSQTVLNFARENREDLIVLGLANHRSLYGGPSVSHAYEIVRQARCPVLSVRSAVVPE
jgi:nucleotide-binding universal stress UspA family protein